MTTPQRPRILFFGGGSKAAGDVHVLQDDFGTTDDGNAFAILLRSNAIIPARPADEVLCYATYLSVGHRLDHATAIELQLFVDERDPLTHTITVPATADYRLSRWEIGWLDAAASGGGQVAQAPRGHRLQVGVRIPQLACGCGTLDLEGVECEVEIRAESIYPATAP